MEVVQNRSGRERPRHCQRTIIHSLRQLALGKEFRRAYTAKLVGTRPQVIMCEGANCYRRFARRAEMNRHLRIHHNPGDEEAWEHFTRRIEEGYTKCPEESCLMTFQRIGWLQIMQCILFKIIVMIFLKLFPILFILQIDAILFDNALFFEYFSRNI